MKREVRLCTVADDRFRADACVEHCVQSRDVPTERRYQRSRLADSSHHGRSLRRRLAASSRGRRLPPPTRPPRRSRPRHRRCRRQRPYVLDNRAVLLTRQRAAVLRSSSRRPIYAASVRVHQTGVLLAGAVRYHTHSERRYRRASALRQGGQHPAAC